MAYPLLDSYCSTAPLCECPHPHQRTYHGLLSASQSLMDIMRDQEYVTQLLIQEDEAFAFEIANKEYEASLRQPQISVSSWTNENPPCSEDISPDRLIQKNPRFESYGQQSNVVQSDAIQFEERKQREYVPRPKLNRPSLDSSDSDSASSDDDSESTGSSSDDDSVLINSSSSSDDESDEETLCQICGDQEAEFWCCSCALCDAEQFFCSNCFGNEHSTRITKGHKRFQLNEHRGEKCCPGEGSLKAKLLVSISQLENTAELENAIQDLKQKEAEMKEKLEQILQQQKMKTEQLEKQHRTTKCLTKLLNQLDLSEVEKLGQIDAVTMALESKIKKAQRESNCVQFV